MGTVGPLVTKSFRMLLQSSSGLPGLTQQVARGPSGTDTSCEILCQAVCFFPYTCSQHPNPLPSQQQPTASSTGKKKKFAPKSTVLLFIKKKNPQTLVRFIVIIRCPLGYIRDELPALLKAMTELPLTSGRPTDHIDFNSCLDGFQKTKSISLLGFTALLQTSAFLHQGLGSIHSLAARKTDVH